VPATAIARPSSRCCASHHLEGRLTVEEFEERVGHAHDAVTLLELGDLHSDLPEIPVRRASIETRRRGAGSSRRAPRAPGSFSFVERVELQVSPGVAREQVFEHIAPALARAATSCRSSAAR